jgi:hypothetical protein
MDRHRDTFNQWFVAAAAAACFIAAIVIAFRAPDEQFWWGGLMRAGVVLTILWFCLPSRGRRAAWAGIRPLTLTILIGVGLLALLRPKIGVPLLVAAITVYKLTGFFRPRRPTG